ncbi:MAG: PstS family phosphate ABC transporter substrate-binding protein [Actinobacteria bacterium]|nr:MAG: PstS family phosphate ABC transporter substrate-binding protein [Actinomycetota bacterium]
MKGTKLVMLGLAAVMTAGAFAAAGCKPATTPAAEEKPALSGSITVEGSDTMVNLAQAWAEKFQEANPGVMVSVKGGGSGNGIAALINGTVDFADASRGMKDEEKTQATAAGVTPVEAAVALDGICVVVNPANGVTNLSVEQLGKIYRGEITNWKDAGGADKAIVLLGRDTSSGTYEYFKEEVVGKEKEYAKSMRNLASTQAIVDEVKGNDAAIGYVGIGYAANAGAEVKLVQLENIEPTIATVADGSYPLSRSLFMYSNGAPEGVAKAYLDWILADGQGVVEEQGFVKIN